MVSKHLIKNLICFFVLSIIVLNLNTLKVYAVPTSSKELTDGSGTTISSDPSENPDHYRPQLSQEDDWEVRKKAGKILGYINSIGIVVSVITLVVAGIKYMIASVEEKDEYKKTMIYYVVGALLLFSATTIPNILYNLTTGIIDKV